ncbi:MAG: L-fucose mutarotase [Oscillospiraceae bacterium]|nr:L-fucose mutarotase [Oscillospiraceae bacterium]
MLKNIPKVISPQLLKVLCEMGHGDEIVIADGNFPAASNANILVRADGIGASDMLNAILSLFPLDQYDDNNFVLMQKCEGDPADTSIWEEYKAILKEYEPNAKVSFEERFAYYERAKKAYAVIATGEGKQYANIILKKGCVL